MKDLIYRQDAIDAVKCGALSAAMVYGRTDEGSTALYETVKAIKALPSAQPTLYGYNIEHLELIARVLQKEDLPPERIVEVLTDIGRIVAIVKDEYEESLRKAVEQCTI